jgi:hypothetical protein
VKGVDEPNDLVSSSSCSTAIRCLAAERTQYVYTEIRQ